MNRNDALRKVRALRNVTLENGALQAEVDSAEHLARLLAERYNIEVDERPRRRSRSSSAPWDHWQWLLREFRLEARRFCNRATTAMGKDRSIVINLDTGKWEVRRASATGYLTIALGRGLESLHMYLRENAPRTYSFYQT